MQNDPCINPAIKLKIQSALQTAKQYCLTQDEISLNTFDEAKMHLRKGNKIGWQQLQALMPNNESHHHWMNFAHVLTILFNENNDKQYFSIIRKAIN